MAQSTEYPDLPFVEPRAWNSGRPNGRPIWIVIHTTEGSEGKRSAEDGAAYDARRTDGTSTHYFADEDTVVQCVRTENRANAAKGIGNQRGIHHELCGRAAQNPTQWDDAASQGTIENDAKQAARDAAKWEIPIRHLTVAQVRDYLPGFCSHSDISAAFGESDHTDPGRNYPWSEYLDLVREEESRGMADFTKDQLVDIAEDAVINVFVRGYHAVLGDDFYNDLNERDKKQANAARDFIINADLIPGGDPKAKTLDVLGRISAIEKTLADIKALLTGAP